MYSQTCSKDHLLIHYRSHFTGPQVYTFHAIEMRSRTPVVKALHLYIVNGGSRFHYHQLYSINFKRDKAMSSEQKKFLLV